MGGDAVTGERRGVAARAVSGWTYPRALASVAILGGLLRFLLLAREPLWRDEAFTAVVARMPLGAMLDAVSRDSAPPLYYALEHLVSQASTAPWALRLVSAAAGTALIPLVAALARRVHGDRAGLWAAAFTAFAPSTVMASRDARMYALASALAVAAALLLWRAVERPRAVTFASYGLIAALAAWTDYFAVLALGAILVGATWWLRPGRRTIAIAVLVTAAALATLAPWVVAARDQLAHASGPFWVEPLGPVLVAGTLAQFASGQPLDPGVPLRPLLQSLQLLAVACAALALVAFVVERDRLAAAERRAAAFCAAAGLLGVLALAVVSPWRPLLDARYASVLWMPLYALAGVGLALVGRSALAFLVTAGLALPSLALTAAITHPRTDLLLPAVEARLAPGDLLVAYPSQYLLVLELGDARIDRAVHVVGTDVPWYWGTAAFPDGAVLPRVPDAVVQAGGRILYVAAPEDPSLDVPAGYRATERTCEVEACLTVFASR